MLGSNHCVFNMNEWNTIFHFYITKTKFTIGTDRTNVLKRLYFSSHHSFSLRT